MLLMNIVDQLNSQKYLYLDKLFEEIDLELCILVDEAKVQRDGLQGIENASLYGAIVSDKTCRKYKITFKNHAAYSVRNESFTVWDDEEEFTGNLFRIYSKSKFLDYVAASTVAVEDVLGAYNHYEIVCLNQIIDVASSGEPLIEIVGAAGSGAT
jgi:hypothetical protein